MIHNFRIIKETSSLSLAVIDITTGILWWKRTKTVEVVRELPMGYWFFLDTGNWCPGFEVEALERAYKIKQNL